MSKKELRRIRLNQIQQSQGFNGAGAEMMRQAMRSDQDQHPKLTGNRNFGNMSETGEFPLRSNTENFVSPRYQERDRAGYDDSYPENQGYAHDQFYAPRMPRNQVPRQSNQFTSEQSDYYNTRNGNAPENAWHQ